MKFEEFVQEMEERVKKECLAGEQVTRHEVIKNNGVVMIGLSIRTDESAVPIVYLNDLFNEFKEDIEVRETETLDSISKELIRRLRESNNLINEKDIKSLSDFNNVKDKLSFRLVNRKRNEKLLDELVYVPVLDLVILFHIQVGRNTTALISKEMMKCWGLCIEDLLRFAMANAPKIARPYFKDLYKLIDELSKKTMIEVEPFKGQVDMYVLTNDENTYGAGVVLYDGQLKKVAEQLNSDLIVLPASIHEVLILPFNGGCVPKELDELEAIISWVNVSTIKDEDFLSNRAYIYERKSNVLKMASPRLSDRQYEIKLKG